MKKKMEMKIRKIMLGIFGLMGIMGLVGCEKESTITESRQEYDIFYTVSNNTTTSLLNGNSTAIHLSSESELDTLLDHFCDLSRENGQVMFCSTQPSQSQSKSRISDTPSTITTSDREELKEWMKEMERIGKTVVVTFDEGNNTWNGTAYAHLNHHNAAAAPQSYEGTLCFVNTPAVDSPAPGGTVWALSTDNDTLILTIQGMMLWNESVTPEMMLLNGMDFSAEGTAYANTDMDGETFMSLEISESENVIVVE